MTENGITFNFQGIAGSEYSSRALELLVKNLHNVETVAEWAMVSGESNPKLFSRKFRNSTGCRPARVLVNMKLFKSIILITEQQDLSCFEIARMIGKEDEKALCQFFIYHTGKCPSHFRSEEGKNSGEKLKSKIAEYFSGEKLVNDFK